MLFSIFASFCHIFFYVIPGFDAAMCLLILNIFYSKNPGTLICPDSKNVMQFILY